MPARPGPDGAARAGLAVLERGGNAMDAALTTAVTQIAVTAGSPVSYFGIMALVYYDAKTGLGPP